MLRTNSAPKPAQRRSYQIAASAMSASASSLVMTGKLTGSPGCARGRSPREFHQQAEPRGRRDAGPTQQYAPESIPLPKSPRRWCPRDLRRVECARTPAIASSLRSKCSREKLVSHAPAGINSYLGARWDSGCGDISLPHHRAGRSGDLWASIGGHFGTREPGSRG